MSVRGAGKSDAEPTFVASGDDADSLLGSDAPASLDTRARFQIFVLDPKIADQFTILLPLFTGPMSRVNCESIGGANVSIDLCDEEDAGDESPSPSILGAPIVCTTPPTPYTSSRTLFAAGNKASLVATAESENVDRLRVPAG